MPNTDICPTIFPPHLSPDWSARTAPEASLQDLDPDAILLARERYKQQDPSRAAEVDALDDAAFLSDLGLLREGSITKAALLLLGKPESTWYLDGSHAILWRLHYGNGDMRFYESFPPPFLTAMDAALDKIRILPYRYQTDPSTLVPEVVLQQDTRVLRELLANAIAHSDYINKSGRVYLDEYEDKVSIISIGSFPRDRVQAVLQDSDGSRMPRNPLLKSAMEKLGMLDPEVRGIRKVYEILRERYFPLPDYDFTFSHQAIVHVHGEVLDETYTRILFTHPDLSLEEVFVLDQVQKHNTRDLHKDTIAALRKRKLIGGRFPHLYLILPEWKRRHRSTKQPKAVTPAKLPQKERSASK